MKHKVLLTFAFCVFSLVLLPAFEVCASNYSKSSKRKQLVNFFAGGIAGTISCSATMPLEVVKTQLQSSRMAGKVGTASISRQILQSEGAKGFFRGLRPMLVGIIPTRAIYFWAYSTSKSFWAKRVGDSPVNHLVSAFAAGITSNTVRVQQSCGQILTQLLSSQYICLCTALIPEASSHCFRSTSTVDDAYPVSVSLFIFNA